MKFAIIASSLALCASVVSAKKATTSLNVPSVLSQFYDTPPTVAAKVSTSLASGLHSVDATWTDSPAYTSWYSAVYSAAPANARSSLDKTGYYYNQITTADWYTKVPKAQQTALVKEQAALNSVASKVIPTGTSKNAAPRETGMAVAGVVGVMGVMAAL